MKCLWFKVQTQRRAGRVRWMIMDRLSNGVLRQGEEANKTAALAAAEREKPALAAEFKATFNKSGGL